MKLEPNWPSGDRLIEKERILSFIHNNLHLFLLMESRGINKHKYF